MASKFDDVFKEISKQGPQIEALGTSAMPIPRAKPVNVEADRLGLALDIAANSNPAEAAHKRQIGTQLSVAPDLVGEGDDLVAFKKRYPASDLADNHPAIARYMVRRDNAALVGKNVDKLQADDSLLRRMVGDPLNALLHKGSLNAVQQLVGIVDLIPGINAGKALQDSGIDLKALKQNAEEMFSATQQEQNKGFAQTKGFGEALNYLAWNPSVAGYAALESTPAMLTGGLIGKGLRTATGGKVGAITAGAVGEGLSIAGSTIEQIRQETPGGVVDNAQRAIALGTGIAGGAISRLGASVAQKAGVADVETMIASGQMKQVLEAAQVPKSLISRVLGGAAIEGATELPQSVIEQVAQNVATGRTWDEGVEQAAALGLVSGGITGGAVQTISQPSDRDAAVSKVLTAGFKKNAQAAQANEHRSIIEQLGKQAAANPLRQTSPEAYREFIDEATQDSEVSDVYVNHEDLTNALAQSGLSEEELTKNIPGLADELKAARATNGDVQIPLADYLTHVAGTKVEPLLLDVLRTTENGLSVKDSEAYFQSQKTEFEESVNQLVEDGLAREEFEADAKTVHDSILESLTKANRFTPAANKVYAQPFAQFYAVNAARLKITPSELYNRLPLKFANLQQGGFTQPIQEGAPSATPEDFSRDAVAGIHNKDNWMMITAYNPKGVQNVPPEQNEAANVKLERDLKAAGIKYEKVMGRYNGMAAEEPSFLVYGVTHQQMLDYTRKYNQDSVLMRNGFMYQDGQIKPRTGTRVFDTVTEGNTSGGYSRVLSTGAIFTYDFDWSRNDLYTPEKEFYTLRAVQPGSLTLRGVHYSKEQRAALRGEFAGTGLPAAERERLIDSEDARIKQRIDFYIDTGKGIKPEAGLGPVVHDVVLTNIYDGSTNPRGFSAPMTPTGMNDFESQVLDAGYDGYFIRQGDQGRVVVMGDAAENVITGDTDGQREGGILPGEARPFAPIREADGSLRNLPRKVGGFNAKHYQKAEEVTRAYMEKAGLSYNPPSTYVQVDEDRARRIANAFDEMKHDPQDPEVARAYEALAAETVAQYQAVVDSGLKVEFIDFEKTGDPYAGNPRAMTEDVIKNNHMWVFSTREGFGSSEFDPKENPLLAETKFEISGQKALVNDLFRVVHDYFGHVKEGVGFRASGEENAWRAHMSMFSPLAGRALTVETRGQNSWVNFGPFAEHNKTASGADTHYADQKIGLLPEWVSTEGVGDAPIVRSYAQFAGPKARTAVGKDLMTAMDRIEAGQDAELVRKETGWYQGVDGKWRFEIDDSQATLIDAPPDWVEFSVPRVEAFLRDMGYEGDLDYPELNARQLQQYLNFKEELGKEYSELTSGTRSLESFLDHPNLYAAYPVLREYKVEIDHMLGKGNAQFNRSTNTITLSDPSDIDTLMHEIQHTIQTIEGFATGGNVRMFEREPLEPFLKSKLAAMQDTLFFAKKTGKTLRQVLESGAIAKEHAEPLLELTDKDLEYIATLAEDAKLTPYEKYRRLAGEIEARNTASRRAFTESIRQRISPEASADIAASEAIVMFNGKVMKSAPPVANARPDQTLNQSAFYSALEREISGLEKIAGKDMHVQPQQAIKWIEARQKDGKFKKEEVEAVGLIDWLAVQEGKITVYSIETFVARNGVEIEEVFLEGEGEPGYSEERVSDLAYQNFSESYDDVEGNRSDIESVVDDMLADPDHRLWSEMDSTPEEAKDMSLSDVFEELTRNVSPIDIVSTDVYHGNQDNSFDYVRGEYEAAAREYLDDLYGVANGGTIYHDYTLRGGENYKELLLKLPSNEGTFTAPHFEEAGAENIIAHTRIDERVFQKKVPLTEAQIAEKKSVEEERSRLNEEAKPLLAERDRTAKVYEDALEAERQRLLADNALSPQQRSAGLSDWMDNPPSDIKKNNDLNAELMGKLKVLRDSVRELPDFMKQPQTEKERVLFVEEIQSDWAQQGRDEGFQSRDYGRLLGETMAAKREYEAAAIEYNEAKQNGLDLTELTIKTGDLRTKWLGLDNQLAVGGRGIPIAPFVQDTKSWTGLVVKRLMRYAAENGFDRIAWTNGVQQAERYDLSKRVRDISYKKYESGNFGLRVVGVDGRMILEKTVPPGELAGIVGKELSDKIISGEGIESKIELSNGDAISMTKLSGVDLEIGGEGMKSFYDSIVPSVFNDVSKKLGGGKVEVVDLGTRNEIEKDRVGLQQSISITPEMKTKIMSGLPLFQGQRAGYNPDTFTISLLKGSDLSSVIHEGGHFYLEALAEMAKMPEATEQIKDDFRKTMEWFGLPEGINWSGMTIEQRRPYHEQWAQSFERYALEGKAPTTALQPIFARFRAWMIGVYKSLKDFLEHNPLAGKLNDDVREIFDRMIAAEDKILEMEKARSYMPLFESAAQAGVSKKEFQEYLDTGSDATERSIDKLSSRSIRDMRWLSNAKTKAIKRLQQEAKAKRKTITDEVTKEVWQEPVNQARAFLKDGDLIGDEGDRNKAETLFKLDVAEVKSLFPERNLAALKGMTAKDGVSPDLAAQMFGFDSGSSLVEALLNAESPSDKIAGLTDQRMLEENGDLTDDEAIERAAEVAIHNEARARFMATGLKMLERSGATTAQIVRAARTTAEAVLSSKRIRDIKPGKFTSAESKANREVLKNLPKDPKAAAAAQRAALLNNRLAKTALDITGEVDVGLRYLKKFATEATRKNLDIDYLDQIDDLLQNFDLRKGVTTTDLNRRMSLSDWIDEQQANGFEPAIDAATMDEVKRKHYKNMTMEEFRGILDSVKQIEHLGRLKKKLLTAKDKRDLAERIAEATDSIKENANRTVKERGTESDVVSLTAKWARSMLAAHRKFSSVIREMDGGKAGGIMWNLLSRTMNEAGDKETDMKQQAAETIGKMFETLPTVDTVPGNLYSKKRLVPGTGISMTHEQRIMFAMNWGNAGNRQRLLDGGITGRKALSQPEAMAVLDTLTKAEWDFVQGVWDYIGSYRDEVAALERKLTGVEPKWIEPSSIATKFGTYKGGYFPAKYDAELSTRSESLEAVTNLRMAMKGAFRVASTRDGYTQARADQVIGRPLLLSYNAISQHLGEVIHRLSWQPWLVDANRLIKGLDSPIREHYGAEILRELRDTINDIAEGDAPAKTPTEAAINRVRIGSTVVGMGWRFSTALLQPSGLAQSWSRIGGRWVSIGVGQALRNPNAASDFVNSKSSMMKNRGITMYREINEVMNTVRAGKAASAYQASFFTMIAKMQRTVDIPTWLGAHEKALHDLKYENAPDEAARKEIEDKAVGMADQAVLDSQSGGQIKDLAKVQRGSPIHKLFTNFYSYFSATYNLNVEAVRRTNFKSPTEVGLLAVDLVLLNVVPVLFSVALKQMLKQECAPDDIECLAEKVGHEQLNFMFGQMILLREVGTAVEVATGGNGYGYQGPAGLRFFSDLYKLGVQVEQGEADMNLFKAANSVAGTLLHYPAGQINSTVDGIIAIEEGRVEGISILPALIAGAPKE